MNATRDLISIGMLAAQAARPVDECLDVLRQLDIEPALRLNGVPYVDRSAVERVVRANVETPAVPFRRRR